MLRFCVVLSAVLSAGIRAGAPDVSAVLSAGIRAGHPALRRHSRGAPRAGHPAGHPSRAKAGVFRPWTSSCFGFLCPQRARVVPGVCYAPLSSLPTGDISDVAPPAFSTGYISDVAPQVAFSTGNMISPPPFRLMQWNLLATGLHTDGFVKPSDFQGDSARLKKFLHLARDYKAWISEPHGLNLVNHTIGKNQDGTDLKTDLESFNEMQGFLNQLIFSRAFVGTPGEEGLWVGQSVSHSLCDGLAGHAALDALAADAEGIAFYRLEGNTPVVDDPSLKLGADAFARVFEAAGTGFNREYFVLAFRQTIKALLEKRLLWTMQDAAKKKGSVDPTKYNPLKYALHGLRWYSANLCTNGSVDTLTNLRASYAKSRESDNPAARNQLTVAALHQYQPDILTAQEIAPDQYVAIAEWMFSRGREGVSEEDPWRPSLPSSGFKSVASLPNDFKQGDYWKSHRPVAWKKTGPVVMGSGVFVNPEKFVIVHAEEVEDPASRSGEGLGMLVKVVSKPLLDAPFCVLSAHLKSGENQKDGAKRSEQLAKMQRSVAASAECRHLELIVGMDGNADRTLGQHSASKNAPAAPSYWDQHLPTSENPWWDGSFFQSYLDLAKLGPGELLVLSNKMRGLFSEQVKKWGEYQLRNIDYVLLKKKISQSLGGLAMTEFVNVDELQRYPVEVLQSLTEETSVEDIINILEKHPEVMEGLMPNYDGNRPSDHAPIVVEFGISA